MGQLFEAQSIRFRYGLVDRSPPGRTDLGLLPAAETFTPELAPDESPPSNVRYGFGADWAICAGGTLTRMNDGFLGRTPPQLTDRKSSSAGGFTRSVRRRPSGHPGAWAVPYAKARRPIKNGGGAKNLKL